MIKNVSSGGNLSLISQISPKTMASLSVISLSFQLQATTRWEFASRTARCAKKCWAPGSRVNFAPKPASSSKGN